MMIHVDAMLSHFEMVARTLQYQPKAGGAVLTFKGVMRGPTPQELAAGLYISARVVVARASTFTQAGVAPVADDWIFDPDTTPARKYAIEPDPTWLYAGSSRLWWRAVVSG